MLGFLVPQQGENTNQEADWYKFHVTKGKIYTLDLMSDYPVMVFVDEPNAGLTEIPLMYNDTLFIFIAAGTGDVYLGFRNSYVPSYLLNPDFHGAEYNFNVQVTGSGWIEPSGETADSSPLDWHSFFVCGCNGESCINPCPGASTMDIYDVYAEVWEINGYFMPHIPTDEEFDLGIYTSEGKEYFDVTVQIWNNVGQGKLLEIYKIIPRVNSDLKTEDRTTYDFVGVPDGDYGIFEAKVPVCEQEGHCEVEMKVFYRVGQASYFTYTDNFILNINIDEPPEIDNFEATINFNSVTLTADISDGDNLFSVDFYVDDPGEDESPECDYWIHGEHKTKTCVWDTSSETDNSQHSAHIIVYNDNLKWARSDEISFTVRNDEAEPEIIDFFVSETDEGKAHGRNVSGKIKLSAIIFDTESGLQDIEWSLGGSVIGTNSSFIWDTGGLNGVKSLKVKAYDAESNSLTRYFTVNVDNTPPTIDATEPSDGDILEGIVHLEVDASDSNTGVAEVEWFLDLNGKQVKIGSGNRTIWGSGGLNGTYTLTVDVSDLVGNTRSRDIEVTIISPDLTVNENGITVAGDTVTVTVHNNGSAGAADITVTVYGMNGTLGSEVIEYISAGGSETVTINMTEAQWNIAIVVDPYNYIAEINEGNNVVEIEKKTAEVAEYHFDENSGSIAYDSSSNENHGIIHGAQWTEGISESALEFDGVDDYVDCGNDSSLDNNVFTISAWIKTSSSDHDSEGLFEKVDLKGYMIYSETWSGNVIFKTKDEYTGEEDSLRSTEVINDGGWHHIAVVRNGFSKKIIYVDGQEDVSATDTVGTVTSNAKFYISPSVDYTFDGELDEIRIYSIALTDEEIWKEYEKYYNPCTLGGVRLCGADYCCGDVDGVCPEDFEGVNCDVVDVDCEPTGCSDGGVRLCGADYCCGVSDGVCPEDFEGVTCSVLDVDCASGCSDGGVRLCGTDYCCGVPDEVCPEDFEGVTCSILDIDCETTTTSTSTSTSSTTTTSLPTTTTMIPMCLYGGVRLCGTDYCCGVSDGVCPAEYEGVDCAVIDTDCTGLVQGFLSCFNEPVYCGEPNGICPNDFEGVSCSFDPEC